MKKRLFLPASFDDLMKRHYGAPSHVMLSNTAKAQRLIANYYGKPLRRGKKRCRPAVPAVTMSYDTGEVLPQRQVNAEPFEEYVVAKSLSEETFEEYVLGDVSAEAPVATASSLQIPRAEAVNVAQEYEVDILQSIGGGSNSCYSQPSLPAPQPTYASGSARRALPPATAQSLSAPAESGRVKPGKPDDDEFVKDMEAILSGKMLYDPVSKTTKTNDAGNRAPQPAPEQPQPPANEQAIFDRIAQSMEYANKYDLGTLEIENRFSDFDRISELQEKSKRDTKLKKSQNTSSIPTVNPTVDSADFLHDLDAIKRQQSAAPAAPAAVGYGQSIGVPAAAAFAEPIQTVCGFFGPDNVVLTEQNLRDGVRDVALQERQAWFDAAGNARSETELGQFGQLVFYNLGRESAILPTTLTAAQAAAISGGVNYNVLWSDASTNAQVNTAVSQVRTALLTGAPNPGNPANLNTLVDQSLRNARSSRLDGFAWSSVFVCTCVRRMAIQLGIEGEVQGTHVGRDELLLAHEAHRVYVVEAFRRRFGPNQKDGTYHAFRIDERAPQVGDIVVQDRQANNIGGVVTFDQIPTVLPAGRNMHGDIVVEVNATDVVTVGGNLSGGVRRRRFPLDANGRLVVAREQLFTQEAADGSLAAVPVVNNAAGLNGQSTGRLVTLLSLVQVCAAVPGQPMNGGILT